MFTASIQHICTLPPTLAAIFTLQLHNFPVDCAAQLFKPSKDVASLLSCNKKKIILGFGFLVGDVFSVVGFWPFGLRSPGPQPKYQMDFFDSNFYWKLGYNLSILSL